jgi:hypothetical protein
MIQCTRQSVLCNVLNQRFFFFSSLRFAPLRSASLASLASLVSFVVTDSRFARLSFALRIVVCPRPFLCSPMGVRTRHFTRGYLPNLLLTYFGCMVYLKRAKPNITECVLPSLLGQSVRAPPSLLASNSRRLSFSHMLRFQKLSATLRFL